jgi:hypothetical protein
MNGREDPMRQSKCRRVLFGGVGLLWAGVIAGCASMFTVAQPEFEWDSHYQSHGTSLAINEVADPDMPPSMGVAYHVVASGFATGSTGELWMKRGSRFLRMPAHVRADGRVVTDTGVHTHMAAGFVPGQPFDVAFVSAGRRAQAKAYPDPIESLGTGGCRASVEVATEDGYLIVVTLLGFAPGEVVEIVSRYEDELFTQTATCPGDGSLSIPILYGFPDRGRAHFTATAGTRSVTVEYNVGADALVAR